MTKKFYNTNDKKFGVRAFEEDGKYTLTIAYVIARFVATKHSSKSHIETDIKSYDKKFDSKESANAYFKKIKETHKTLAQVSFWEFDMK